MLRACFFVHKRQIVRYKNRMRVLISFLVFISIKTFAKVFYRFDINWLSGGPNFDKIRLVVLLNHTSLYEPIYVAIAPFSFLWRLSRKMVAPGADKTLNRPIVGFFWKIMAPGLISITRKRDKSWSKFLKAIENRSVIVIAPEGRMKRKNGLDATGKPMTVRSGVSDIIHELHEGNILFVYSGGLHHIQHPGDHFPRLFKTIKAQAEVVDIEEYKKGFVSTGIQWKRDIVADLENRIKLKCPLSNS